MRTLTSLLALAAAVSLASPAAAQLGRTLEEVRKEDFWTYFHLEPTGPARVEGGRAVTEFRTTAPRFRPLARVTAEVDSGGVIRAMGLELARSFVDDPLAGVFARDIAKSFLRAALPADDLPDMETLANEIEHPREDAPGTTTVRLRPAPDLPSTPTPAYEVYLGRAPSFSRTLEACVVELRNSRGGDDSVLTISIAGR
jgi:hypothetical protein